MTLKRYLLQVIYDGTCFHGSQIQGTTPTVQLALNNALSTLLRMPIPTVGASRTDEGVHARCNYYHFDLADDLRPDMLYKLNAILPPGIAISAIARASDPDFNARFEAVRRRYRYRIYTHKDPFLLNRALFYPFTLDHEALNETAAIIKEYTQFESFCKRNAQSHTFNCTIHESYWELHGDELHYVVEANRFLRGMVRGLVATQLNIARGKATPQHLRHILDARDCTQALFNVHGHGLYLEEITYPAGSFEVLQGTI